MSNRWVIVLGGLLVALLAAASAVAILKIDLRPKPAKGKKVERTRNFAEGLKLSRKGLYGVDLVSIGRAHMRKVRKGPFTIGALNELVLEDVSLALPEELWKEKVAVKGQGEGDGTSDTSAKAMLGRLGIDTSRLKMGGKIPRFSALSVHNLRVARLDGTNAVPWFAAAGGKAEREGLALYNGWSIENGVSNNWKEAFLVVEPKLKLFHP